MAFFRTHSVMHQNRLLPVLFGLYIIPVLASATHVTPSTNRTQTSISGSTELCGRSCTISMPDATMYWWQSAPFVTSTLVAATVVYVIDHSDNTTRTKTLYNPSVSVPPTQSPMTVATAIKTHGLNGSMGETNIAYPTAFVDYNNEYWWSGTKQVISGSKTHCETASGTTVAFRSRPTLSTTWDTDPDDPYGTRYYLDSSSSFSGGIAPMTLAPLFPELQPFVSRCAWTGAVVAPLHALETRLYLTETSTSHKNREPTESAASTRSNIPPSIDASPTSSSASAVEPLSSSSNSHSTVASTPSTARDPVLNAASTSQPVSITSITSTGSASSPSVRSNEDHSFVTSPNVPPVTSAQQAPNGPTSSSSPMSSIVQGQSTSRSSSATQIPSTPAKSDQASQSNTNTVTQSSSSDSPASRQSIEPSAEQFSLDTSSATGIAASVTSNDDSHDTALAGSGSIQPIHPRPTRISSDHAVALVPPTNPGSDSTNPTVAATKGIPVSNADSQSMPVTTSSLSTSPAANPSSTANLGSYIHAGSGGLAPTAGDGISAGAPAAFTGGAGLSATPNVYWMLCCSGGALSALLLTSIVKLYF